MSSSRSFDALGQVDVAVQQGLDRRLHLVFDDRAQGENALLDPVDFALQVYRHVWLLDGGQSRLTGLHGNGSGGKWQG